jgi:hypothetical protein
MRRLLFAGAAGLAALAWHAAPCAQDEASQLQQLLAENQNLTVQIGKAKKVEEQVGKAELTLKGWDAALKAAREELHHSQTGIVREFNMVHQRARETGCPWGATLEKQDAYVASCNAKGADLNAMLRDLQKQGATAVEMEAKLNQKQQELGNETLVWFKKKKANNNDLETLYAANANWQRRYNAFVFNSEAYRRLQVTAPGSQFCESLSGNGNDVEKLRSASQCLQRLFDGARRR